MKELQPADAEKIHNIIMASGDAALIKEYKDTLKAVAEMREGMFAMDMGWRATKLPESVKAALAKEFGIKKLYNRNMLSFNGDVIELRVLAYALPEKIVTPYFSFDPEQSAKEAGIDFEEFKGRLKAAFKGTVGQPGKPDFGILIDAAIDDKDNALRRVTGLGIFMHPYDKHTVDRLSAREDFKKGDLPEIFKAVVSQGQQVYDKGIDAKSVYIVTPRLSALAVKVMSKILNLPKP